MWVVYILWFSCSLNQDLSKYLNIFHILCLIYSPPSWIFKLLDSSALYWIAKLLFSISFRVLYVFSALNAHPCARLSSQINHESLINSARSVRRSPRARNRPCASSYSPNARNWWILSERNKIHFSSWHNIELLNARLGNFGRMVGARTILGKR